MKLKEILKDSNYKLTQFSQDKIDSLESSTFMKQIKEDISKS